MAAPPLAASVWGTPGVLPSLDPASLYAEALLQLAYGSTHAVYALEPRTWPHSDTVPSLYAAEGDQHRVLVGDPLATTPDAIRAYLREHSPLDAPLRQAPLAAARAQAAQAVLDDALADLVLHALFSLPANFQKVTAPGLAEPRRHVLPSSLPRRLRAAVRARLESPSIGLWGLGGSWEREERLEARRWNATAGLAEARDPASQLPKTGMAQHPGLASDVKEQWERSRIAARARELFATLRTMLGEGEFLVGCTQPTSVDARMYSLLAPLVLSVPRLPIDVLPALLDAEFPELVRHTKRMHTHLWGVAPKEMWAWQRPKAEYSQPALTLAPLWDALSPKKWMAEWRAEKKSEERLPPTLRYGRLAFGLWAVFGSLAYIALTGLITIEYDEEGEEDEVDPDEVDPEIHPEEVDPDEVEPATYPPPEEGPPDMGTIDPSEFLEDGMEDDE